MYMESVEIKSVDLLTEDPATWSATPWSKRTTSSSLPSRTHSALTTSLRNSIGHFQGKSIHVVVLLPKVNSPLVCKSSLDIDDIRKHVKVYFKGWLFLWCLEVQTTLVLPLLDPISSEVTYFSYEEKSAFSTILDVFLFQWFRVLF